LALKSKYCRLPFLSQPGVIGQEGVFNFTLAHSAHWLLVFGPLRGPLGVLPSQRPSGARSHSGADSEL
jgi:hypothetical protein